MSGYPLAHAVMMMIPEAWEQHTLMDESRRAFYEYHAAMMEPWDGPAAVAFTDGRQIGATLDRNGLRPARYMVTDDDLVILASEAGALPIPENAHRQEVAPAAGQDVPDRPGTGPHHRRRGDQAATGQQPSVPPVDRTPADQAGIAAGPAPGRRRHAIFGVAAGPPAGLRLHPGRHQVHARAHGRDRRGRDRLDGQRHAAGRAVRPRQAALQLLPPAVRPGHQPADRPDPREDGDVAGVVHRPQAQPAGHQQRQPADAPGSVAAGAGLRRHGADPRHRAGDGQEIPQLRAGHHLPGRLGPRGHRSPRGRAVRARRGRGAKRLQHPDRVGPPGRQRARGHPRAAGHVGGAPPPGPRRPAHQHRPGGGDRHGPRSAPLRAAGRLRRRGHPPLPGAGNAGQDERPGKGRQELHQGDRQGPEEGHVQDGHLHLHVLLRRADLRGRRPAEQPGEQVLHRHRLQHRRHRHLRGRRGSAAPAPRRLRQRPGPGERPRSGRRVRLPRARRRAHVDARRDRQAAACHARQQLPHVQGIRAADQRPEPPSHDAARPVRVQVRSVAAPSRSTRSSRPRTSSSASPPARCRWARSRPRPTRRWPWR